MSTPNEHHEHMAEPQRLVIPFTVPNRGPCTVTITVEPAKDPVRIGQGLTGLYKDPNVVKGYPVIEATISSPESRTYAALYGWVQITNTPGETWIMDRYPLFSDVNSPFAFWGAEPTLVDAPAREGVENYTWMARSFLCYSPDAAMTKTVVPILGFEWGFWIKEGKPYVKRLLQLDVGCWNGHLDLFRGKFEGWTFREVAESKQGEGETDDR